MERVYGIARAVPGPNVSAGRGRGRQAQQLRQKGNGTRGMVPDEMHCGDGGGVGRQRRAKCPNIAAKAVGMVAWLKGGGWGSNRQERRKPAAGESYRSGSEEGEEEQGVLTTPRTGASKLGMG